MYTNGTTIPKSSFNEFIQRSRKASSMVRWSRQGAQNHMRQQRANLQT